jgi:hypothetical protein
MMLMTPLSHHNSYGNSVCGCQYCTLYIELERPKPSFSIPASPSGNYDDNISTPPRPPFVTSPLMSTTATTTTTTPCRAAMSSSPSI